MKDLKTVTQNDLKLNTTEMLTAAATHILMAALGFICARGVVLETLMPFGLVVAAGSTAVFLPSLATGAFIGYFIPAVNGGFRYISALLAVVAIRLVLSSCKRLAENPFFLSFVAAVSNLVTGAVTYSGVPLDALRLAAETLLIFGAVFLCCRAFYSLSNNRYGISNDSLACVLLLATIVLIGLADFKLFGISVGRTMGAALILISAKYGGTLWGAVCGIAVSFSAALTGAFESGFGIYAVAGLLAGVFGSLGKYAQAASVIASGIIGLSFMRFGDGSSQFLAEIITAAVIFILIPRSLGVTIGRFFYRQPRLANTDGVNKALNLRLKLASDALTDVSDTVCQVSRELAKINTPDFKTMLSYIEQDACTGCKLRMHCWESRGDSTVDAIMCMISNQNKCDTVPNSDRLDEFKSRCLRPDKMQSAVKSRHSEYASLLAAESRIEEVRLVVSEQFEGISNMLNELATEFATDEQFDTAAAEVAAAALKNIGITATQSAAKIDKYGRMSLEMKLQLQDDTVINRLQIMKLLSLACERNFDIPNITKTADSAIMTVGEQAHFRVDIGVDQRSASVGAMCGDAFKYFNDGKGHFIMVLSDGMGTGGRAAVDGAMASGLMARLIKSGFGYDCSLKILNSSMLFKSTDESLATMDIASIDLFTGAVELYKAGAAPTVVRRSGRAGRAESTSLPIGILKDVSFDRAGIRLKQSDILLLVSDGVTSSGTEWIRSELEAWRDGGAQDLAEHICDCARRRRTEAKADDITVMAAILEKTSA